MSRIYHEKTRYSDYFYPTPTHTHTKKKKGGMKKGQRGRRGSPSSKKYYYQTNAKPLTLYQEDSSFMTLKEVHIQNVKKGEKCWL